MTCTNAFETSKIYYISDRTFAGLLSYQLKKRKLKRCRRWFPDALWHGNRIQILVLVGESTSPHSAIRFQEEWTFINTQNPISENIIINQCHKYEVGRINQSESYFKDTEILVPRKSPIFSPQTALYIFEITCQYFT